MTANRFARRACRFLVVLGLGCCVGTGAQGPAVWGVHLDGRPVSELASPTEKAVVLFFVATDCPVSNRTFPEMLRLRARFGGQKVRFWFVYPNTDEHASEVASHQRAFGGDAEALEDPSGALVHLSHAVATPEMVVLTPGRGGWQPVYAGRIDDRFERLGVERPNVTRHFGEEVLQAVVAGTAVEAPVGRPVGCAIMNPGVR